MANGLIKRDVIIIGAGAAGLMCAIEAGKRGRKVSVLDHTKKTGQKIRISGGGNCNFTNINAGPEHYISQNPHFCKSALSRFTPGDFILLLRKHGIGHREKEEGQLFCDEGSGAVLNMIRKECEEAGVEIHLNCRISEISKQKFFKVVTNRGAFFSGSLGIATGGLSYPKLGATGFGHKIAEKFGIKITPLKPALVPLLFNQKDLRSFSELSGVSVKAKVSCNNKEFYGNILFTHKGLSGPAILQISSYWDNGDAVHIDLLPDIDILKALIEKRQSRIEMKNLLALYFPRRFIQKWCEMYIRSKPVCQYSDKELEEIVRCLKNWEIKPAGTEGYSRAEVTLGGVDTDELSSKTMEAKKVPGLYFIGEVVDVTGQLGGYNLQWAWSSGYAAGRYA
ncbi:MAG: NAD(P)/FAD-dependent oxidoreductase [Thermodesulfovibrionia bacterium]|nr:NAD(P)/FAD-dependent oxidoreductase [Thermodesulfovibrionia bacterium]